MLSLTELLRKYSVEHHNEMRVITSPLLKYEIPYFHFHQVRNDGRFFFISNRVEYNEYFYSQNEMIVHNPYTVCPNLINEGIYDYKAHKFPRLDEALLAMNEKVNIEIALSVIRKTEDGYVNASFGFSNANPYIIGLIGRNNRIFQRYLTHFMDEMRPILKKSEDDAADLHAIMGTHFVNPDYQVSNYEKEKNEFFHMLQENKTGRGLAPIFTEREKECLRCCRYGMTDGQIANKLNLSRRTIEKRIIAIRIKLDCSKKGEIISKIRHLESQGLLDL